MNKLCISLVIICVCFSQVTRLKTVYQNSYPKFFIKNGVMNGICYDILSEIKNNLEDIQIDAPNTVTTISTIKTLLLNKKIDFFIGLARNSNRERAFRYIDIPLYDVNHGIVFKKNNIVNRKNFQLFMKTKQILCVKGTNITVNLSKIKKYKNLDASSNTPSIAIKRLLADEGEAVYYHDLGLKNILKEIKPANDLELFIIPNTTYSHYLVFKKNMDLNTIKIFKNILLDLKENGTLRNIYKRYTEFSE